MGSDMKKFFLILVSALFLTACGGGGTASLINSADNLAKPKFPHKKPAVPTTENSGTSGAAPQEVAKPSELNMDRIISKINASITPPNILAQDIERGWYMGGESDKKDGTPGTWIWVNKGKESAWMSPSALDDSADNTLEKLCNSTAGSYAFSCIEREFPGCEYIAKSICRCPDQTVWVDDQGCILTDKNGGALSISASDLKRGWYSGLPNEKKLDTPNNWVWIEGGKKSRWQTPSPSGGN
jgi:hypothetical protein